jgi:pentatricopeptide repeat protein
MAAAAFALNAKEKAHSAAGSSTSNHSGSSGPAGAGGSAGGASHAGKDKEPSFADQLEEYFFQKKGFSNEKWTKHGEELIPAYLKPEHVREAFKLSVQARTVGNHELRKYLKYMDLSEYKNAMEAAKGAQEGGLRLDAETCEVLLSILLRAGQLREALELYQTMIKSRITPHTKSYNHLIQLAVDKQSPYAAHTLFEDMKRKGRSPDVETYELLMQAFALEKPPNWQEAVEIFDKLQSKRSHQLSSSTYNALMKVYLNMTPFDYRIVYNAYYEMRYSRPRIRFGWDSYALVAEAMRRGNAPVLTRIALKIDAWVQIVSLRSLEFWIVATGVVICTFLVRYWIIRFCWFMSATTQSESHVDVGTKVMKMGG